MRCCLKDFGFTLEDGLCIQADPSTPRPKVVREAYQVMECTWMSDLENAADRTDLTVHFTDDALDILLNVPRAFLPTVLKNCIVWAKEHNVTEVTAKEKRFA